MAETKRLLNARTLKRCTAGSNPALSANLYRPEFDSIIFDLDGTLWDASQSTSKAWTRAAQKLGCSTNSVSPAAIRAVSGLSFDQCIEEIFPEEIRHCSHFKLALDLAEKVEILRSGGSIYPDILEQIPKLHQKYKLFLVSNCQDWYLEAFFEQTGLRPYFSDFNCFGSTGLNKTENIRRIVAQNQLKKPVYVGDTQWDQQASFFAGIAFIFARYGFGSVNTNRCPSVGSFEELSDWFLSPQQDKPLIDIRRLQKKDFQMAQDFYRSVGYNLALDKDNLFLEPSITNEWLDWSDWLLRMRFGFCEECKCNQTISFWVLGPG